MLWLFPESVSHLLKILQGSGHISLCLLANEAGLEKDAHDNHIHFRMC